MDQPKHKKAIERKTWHQIPFLLSFACCCWARGRVIRSEGNHKAPERRKTVAKRKRRVEKMKLIISISSRHGIRIHKWFRCFLDSIVLILPLDSASIEKSKVIAAFETDANKVRPAHTKCYVLRFYFSVISFGLS